MALEGIPKMSLLDEPIDGKKNGRAFQITQYYKDGEIAGVPKLENRSTWLTESGDERFKIKSLALPDLQLVLDNLDEVLTALTPQPKPAAE